MRGILYFSKIFLNESKMVLYLYLKKYKYNKPGTDKMYLTFGENEDV